MTIKLTFKKDGVQYGDVQTVTADPYSATWSNSGSWVIPANATEYEVVIKADSTTVCSKTVAIP